MYSILRVPAFASFAALGLLSALTPLAPQAAAQASPTVSVDDVVVAEGGTATFNVRVSGAHPNFSVDYRTVDISAVSPDDYTSTTGTLTIPSGSSVVGINVPTAGDKIWEPDETFKLVLTSSPITISDGVGIGTITDDDPVPTASLKDASVTEGDSPLIGTNMVFDVTLSNAASEDVTVDWQTLNGTAVGSLILAFGDFQTSSGTVTFPANSKATQHINVPVRGDITYEKDETFQVQLSNPLNARLGTKLATGTILEDDPRPGLSIQSSALVAEGNGTSTLGLTVSLTNPSSTDVGFTVDTSNGTAHAGGDYTRIRSGSGTVLAGHTTATVNVDINGDTTHEDTESFYVTLSAPSGAGLGVATSEVTILDDD